MANKVLVAEFVAVAVKATLLLIYSALSFLVMVAPLQLQVMLMLIEASSQDHLGHVATL